MSEDLKDPSYILQRSDLVLFGSPLHTIGQFVYFLQQRFSSAINPTPWPWDADDNVTKIYVGSYLEVDAAQNTSKPRITVSRGTMTSSRVSMGDIDQTQPEWLHGGVKYSYRQKSLSIRIRCTARTPGESEVLGDIVCSAIDMSREEILSEFGLRDIPVVVFQPPQPDNADGNKLYTSRVEFQLNSEFRYAHVDAAEPLREVRLSTNSAGGLDYAKNLIIRRTDLPSP